MTSGVEYSCVLSSPSGRWNVLRCWLGRPVGCSSVLVQVSNDARSLSSPSVGKEKERHYTRLSLFFRSDTG